MLLSGLYFPVFCKLLPRAAQGKGNVVGSLSQSYFINRDDNTMCEA